MSGIGRCLEGCLAVELRTLMHTSTAQSSLTQFNIIPQPGVRNLQKTPRKYGFVTLHLSEVGFLKGYRGKTP